MKPLSGQIFSAVGIVLLLTLGASVTLSQETHAASISTRAAGAGRWESSQDASREKRDWQIEIERFIDDSIAGSIIVIGSPYLHKARIEGRVEGKEVYGVLVGDDESQVGTFSGVITDSGLSGTYTTKQGDSGSWTWAGPAGARSLKGETAETTKTD